MPDKLRINRPVSDALLTFIQNHPRVVSAVRSNAGTAEETTLITLDANYTEEQIQNAVTRLIQDKQIDLTLQDISARLAEQRQQKPPEYEVL
jgi:hypothetical protein